MVDEAALLYLEPDDEITTAVRRLRDADARRVVLVAPGRSKATSSSVALRLLQRLAAEGGREVGVVGDALTRSLASEAGLATYATVDDARASVASAPSEQRRAAIHVVRREEPTVPVMPAASAPRQAVRGTNDETRIVAVPASAAHVGHAPEPGAIPGARRAPLVAAALVAALLLAAGGAVAAVLPYASVTITPATQTIGPLAYELRFESPQIETGVVQVTVPGNATGGYHDLAAASGLASFRNFNIGAVSVAQGTTVAVGETVFVTTAAVTVPPGQLTPDGRIAAGEATAGITATVAGPAGNVAAEAIDTILDTRVRNALRGFPQNAARLVINYEATAGGLDASGPVIEQVDVDAAVGALHQALADAVAEKLAATEGLVVADAPAQEPVITVPEGLVGLRDTPSFEMSGELAYDRATVEAAEVEQAAREQLASDPSAVASGHELLSGSERLELGAARRDGDTLVVPVTVTARSSARIDATGVADRIAGLPIEQARSTLSELGAVQVDAWPEWVDAIPRLPWRIAVSVTDPQELATPAPTGSPAP